MRTMSAVSFLLASLVCRMAQAQPLGPALAADDECAAGHSSEAACGLEALQLRAGQKSMQEVAELDANAGCQYTGRSLAANEGQELRVITGSSEAGCAAACDQTSSCHSFALGISGQDTNKCYLKTGWITASDPTSTDTWRVQRYHTFYKLRSCTGHVNMGMAVPGYIERTLVAHEGTAVGSRSHSTPVACGSFCDATNNCHSFSFSFGGDDENTCYLKSGQVTASDSASTDAWNAKTYRTYYKLQQATHFSEDYGKFSECIWPALVASPNACTEAAEDLGYGTYRPQLVPPTKGSLPPGCFWTAGVKGLGHGLFYNDFGLNAFGKASDAKSFKVLPGEDIDMLCRKKFVSFSRAGQACRPDRQILDMGECQKASLQLNAGYVRPVDQSMQFGTVAGCFKSTDPRAPGMWFNKPLFTTAQQAPPTVHFACRDFGPQHS